MNSGTWFADSPVIIKVDGLNTYWPTNPKSPFNVVRVEIIHNSKVYGEVKADTGGAASIEFDISSALRAIWAEEDFSNEVSKANSAAAGTGAKYDRSRHQHMFHVYLEYVSDGILEKKDFTINNNSYNVAGGMTEWERSLITDSEEQSTDINVIKAKKSVLRWDKSNNRFGSASTKPVSSPEHVGINSITSWVGITEGHTTSRYCAASAGQEPDDGTREVNYQYREHNPIVLRDSQEYVDFLFVNRRGAVETCSGLTKEAMDIGLETKQYGRVEGPSFKPTRSLAALGSDGRRSWNMSSGYVTRDWAEWWASEFLGGKRKRWWMRWKGPGMTTAKYVPVIVEPAKKSVTIYDRSKQNMAHVDFTVTLALEG